MYRWPKLRLLAGFCFYKSVKRERGMEERFKRDKTIKKTAARENIEREK
jgi:hypothetical protein